MFRTSFLACSLAGFLALATPGLAGEERTFVNVTPEGGFAMTVEPVVPQAPETEGTGGTIRGIVLADATGDPLSSISVIARHESGTGSASTFSASDGSYEIEVPFDGNWYVLASRGSYVRQLFPLISCVDLGEVCQLTSGTPVAVAGGSDTGGIDFSLIVGGRIEGIYVEQTTGFDANDYPTIHLFDAGGNLVIRLNRFLSTLLFDGDLVRTFVTDPIPAGDYFVATSSIGMVDQLFPEIDCPDLSCTITTGDLVAVSSNSDTPNIDFRAALDPLQGGAFSGDASGRNVDEIFPVSTVVPWDPVTQERVGGQSSSGLSYVAAGLPDGIEARAIADGFAHLAELYDNIPCEGPGAPSCDLGPGTPIPITGGTITSGVDFCLVTDADLLEDGFECGDLAAWSSVLP